MRMKDHLKRPALNGKLVRWFESLLSMGAMALLQMTSFILLARAIGVEGYGIIVSVAATATVAVEFVGLGCGDALIRSVARNRETHRAVFGQALLLIWLTLPIVAIAAIAFERVVFELNFPLAIVASLTVSELTSARALALSEQVAIAHETVRVANVYRFLFAATRMLIVIVACYCFDVNSIKAWWRWQFAFGMITPNLFLLHASWRFGRPKWRLDVHDIPGQFAFALNQILRALQLNVDRMVLGHFADASVLGVYGVAARFIQFLLLPVQAVLRMTYPTYFQHGVKGIGSTRIYARRLFPAILAMTTVTAIFIILTANLFARILGHGYGPIAGVMRGLCILPAIIGTQYVWADALTGADHQNLRTFILGCGTASIAGAAWIGVRWFGLYGIVGGVIAANGILAVLYFAAVEWITQRQSARDAASRAMASPN